MEKKIGAFYLLLKDLMGTRIIFGEKVVIFCGNFRQTLPIVRSEKKRRFIVKIFYALKFETSLKSYNY